MGRKQEVIDLKVYLFCFRFRNVRGNRYIFGLLCKAAMELNHVFSFVALWTISSRLVSSIQGLFFLIQQIVKSNPQTEFSFWMPAALLLQDWAMILVFFNAADMPARQVDYYTPFKMNPLHNRTVEIGQVMQLREHVIVMHNSRIERDFDLTLEVTQHRL